MASNVPAVTPVVGPNFVVPTAGGNVEASAPNPNGGLIVNPISAAGQGIDAPEVLYIDPTGAEITDLVEGGSVFALQPGESWNLVPGQTTPTTAAAATAGHRFSVVQW